MCSASIQSNAAGVAVSVTLLQSTLIFISCRHSVRLLVAYNAVVCNMLSSGLHVLRDCSLSAMQLSSHQLLYCLLAARAVRPLHYPQSAQRVVRSHKSAAPLAAAGALSVARCPKEATRAHARGGPSTTSHISEATAAGSASAVWS